MLPSRPDRPLLRAFVASVACLAGGTAGTVVGFAWAAGAGAATGFVVALAILVATVLADGLAAGAYRFWKRLSRAYARVARTFIIWIIHYMVLTPVGRLGGSGAYWQSPSDPGWFPRHAPGGSRPVGRAWSTFLRPLLAALRLVDRLESREALRVPTTTYTLY